MKRLIHILYNVAVHVILAVLLFEYILDRRSVFDPGQLKQVNSVTEAQDFDDESRGLTPGQSVDLGAFDTNIVGMPPGSHLTDVAVMSVVFSGEFGSLEAEALAAVALKEFPNLEWDGGQVSSVYANPREITVRISRPSNLYETLIVMFNWDFEVVDSNVYTRVHPPDVDYGLPELTDEEKEEVQRWRDRQDGMFE